MSEISCLADCNCWINQDKLAKIKPYIVPDSEVAAPVTVAAMWFVPVTYHTITYTGRVAIARYDEPIKFRWIEGTRTRRAEKVRVKV